jgi:hypothetical protein
MPCLSHSQFFETISNTLDLEYKDCVPQLVQVQNHSAWVADIKLVFALGEVIHLQNSSSQLFKGIDHN